MTFADVLVRDFNYEILDDAKVVLTSYDPNGKKRPKSRQKAIELCFDDRTQSYRGKVPHAGIYHAEISADGFQTDRDDIRAGLPGPQESFALGHDGMPHYFRGVRRVPFDPCLAQTLLGVAFDAQAKKGAVRNLERALKKRGLDPEETPKGLAELPFRLFRFDTDIDEGQRSEIIRFVLSNEAVKYAGALVLLNDRTFRMLTNDFIAKFRPEVAPKEVAVIAKKHGFQVVRRLLYVANAYLLRSVEPPGFRPLLAANALAQTGAAFYVEPDLVMPTFSTAITPTDPEFANQWHLDPGAGDADMRFQDAWQLLRDETTPAGISPDDPGDITFGSEEVVVAVFDDGIASLTHPDFMGQVSGGADKIYQLYDFENLAPDNSSPITTHHGANVAGVVGALVVKDDGSNNDGVVGVAANCPIISAIRANITAVSTMTDAWSWLAGLPTGDATLDAVLPDPGADVINNSFTYDYDPATVTGTFDTIASMGRKGRGTIVVFAAGNAGGTVAAMNAPATHPAAIAVAASTRDDSGRWASSNTGADVDVCAPGEAIHTATGTNGFGAFNDTSAAAPIVSGIVALMLSMNPRLNWQEVRDVLRNTAARIDSANADWDALEVGHHIWYGFGRVNAFDAVDEARARLATGTDIVIRDNTSDDGGIPSSAPYWNSPDIWVRRTDDPIPPVTGPGALDYSAAGPHEHPERGHDNYIFLRFKNVGTDPVPADEVKVRALICHWPGFAFNYPDHWIPSYCPSGTDTITEAGTYLIGEAFLGALDPDEMEIVKITWPEACIPPAQALLDGMMVNWHPCMLVEISPHDGPFPTGTAADVADNNNLAQKNLTIIG